MELSVLPKREAGQQCYIMVGDAIKYEPVWQAPSTKQVLGKTAVNDNLTSVTAGLNVKSMTMIREAKRKQLMENTQKISTGALMAEDVGLQGRVGGMAFNRKSESLGRSTWTRGRQQSNQLWSQE